ncbi:hypothetical protein DPMN_072972 [Dreissena polymorpha]|uniref:Secreted protein n=1 Tax=Dreissena polymorpha TaxID=45954 RepID=A0A9D4HA68_DREPO|nr:hypothetical protein DPMN_072972 [Dreissena polymorpha]
MRVLKLARVIVSLWTGSVQWSCQHAHSQDSRATTTRHVCRVTKSATAKTTVGMARMSWDVLAEQ